MRVFKATGLLAVLALAAAAYSLGASRVERAVPVARTAGAGKVDLWKVYRQALRHARYINLSHVIAPRIPVWKGFGPSEFRPSLNPDTGEPYTYAKDGFEATQYRLATDQLGTQLDPPAHWDANRPAIDELPPTYAVRPLVVISIVDQVADAPDYHLQVSDVRAWERSHGRIPRGSVVMVRSDWSSRWPDPALAQESKFPGVSLDALKFLHRRRHILFHGHEPLDTDTTPTLEGESWLMHHGYAQAEGVAHLDRVPAKGCLLNIGFPRFKGGVGGYASYVAICPLGSRHGRRIGPRDAPLRAISRPLHWDAAAGTRVR
jgi:kynurenine formamidase